MALGGLHGDINEDKSVDINDITSAKAYVISGDVSGYDLLISDFDGSGQLDVNDITAIKSAVISDQPMYT